MTTIKSSWTFCNKIWQATRFVVLALERKPSFKPELSVQSIHSEKMSFLDKWILSRCADTVAKADVSLQNLEFHLLTRALRSFLYSSLCDIYVEAVKKVLSDPHHPQFEATLQTIYLALITGLRLMHPVMPFITEELYQRLKNFGNGSGGSDSGKITSIMVEPFPIANEWEKFLNAELDEVMENGIMEAVTTSRQIKEMYGMKRSQLPRVIVHHPALMQSEAFREHANEIIETLVPCQSVTIVENVDTTLSNKWSKKKLPSGMQVLVELEGHVDVKRELKRIDAKLTKTQSNLNKMRAKEAAAVRKTPTEAEITKISALLEEIEILQEQKTFLESLS